MQQNTETTSLSPALKTLQNKIADRSVKVGIFGLGYVGLPLALRFAEVGVQVLGFDIDESKVLKLNNGGSYIERITPEQIRVAQQ